FDGVCTYIWWWFEWWLAVMVTEESNEAGEKPNGERALFGEAFTRRGVGSPSKAHGPCGFVRKLFLEGLTWMNKVSYEGLKTYTTNFCSYTVVVAATPVHITPSLLHVAPSQPVKTPVAPSRMPSTATLMLRLATPILDLATTGSSMLNHVIDEVELVLDINVLTKCDTIDAEAEIDDLTTA
ncbi:hypothetical protein Ancab_024878, partial [Ancistrocladus abbreviatus]